MKFEGRASDDALAVNVTFDHCDPACPILSDEAELHNSPHVTNAFTVLDLSRLLCYHRIVAVITVRYSERPELWDRVPELFAGVWPEYNIHGDVMEIYWTRLFEQFAAFQVLLYDDEENDIVAASRSIPYWWDGTPEGLGPGIDATIISGFTEYEDGGEPNTLCALGIEIPPQHQGKRISQVMLREMAGLARSAGFGCLTVPVRPVWKDRYPLTSIDRYMTWVRDDGSPFDPWIRVHVEEGGIVVKPIPRSSRITGTVPEWESWTQMRFPDDGDYVFPDGLATLHVDHANNLGSYWEPNVWVIHEIDPC